MKNYNLQVLFTLLLLGKSLVMYGQILTSELEVREGATVIEDATTIKATLAIDKPAIPNNGTMDAEAHLVLKGANTSSTDIVGIKFHQTGASPFGGQIRFNSHGFHFTNGEDQSLRSIFVDGLSASSVTSDVLSGGSFTNQSGGAADFPAGLISDKVEGDVVGWTTFTGADPAAQQVYANLAQGIYLLTIRGQGVYHAYSTFILHCYDNHNKGATRLFNTAYQSEWSVNIVWNLNYTFNVFADPSKPMQGRFSLLRLN